MPLNRYTVLCLALAVGPVSAEGMARIVVQHSPVAGFKYYHGKALWDGIRVGDRLTLVREPDNPHDPNAVRVDWRGRSLGYVPRRENSALAWAMDRGEPVGARISALRAHRNPRQRIEFEVFVE